MYSKRCSRCNVIQTAENSHFRKSGHFQSYCRPCRNEVTKKYASANKEQMSVIQRRAHFKHRYGLNETKYLELIANGCAICGSHDNLCVDHDHACCPGKNSCGSCVRGVLCQRHNKALGFVSDSTDELHKMIQYLLPRNG
jgi:hypothetical protein